MGEDLLYDLHFADDVALVTKNEADMQKLTDNISTLAKKFSTEFYHGLQINEEKTNVIDNQSININVNGKNLKQVDAFMYLESYLHNKGSVENDIYVRTRKASSLFNNLQKIWKCKSITNSLKFRLLNSTVRPATIYAC